MMTHNNATTNSHLINIDDDDDKKKKSRKRPLWTSCCNVGPYQRRKIIDCMILPAVVVALIGLHQILVEWSLSANAQIKPSDLPVVDFVVGGFPKCGTTTLLYALHNHPDIVIPSRESCALKDTWRKTFRMRQRYQAEVKEIEDQLNATRLSSSPNKQLVTGLKCPTAIYSSNYMERIREINEHHLGRPVVKWIVGIRHPIHQVQSFYNYRITELYDKKKWWKDIRPLSDIMSSSLPWKDMSSVAHQYQLYLQDLVSFLQNRTSVPKPTIFLYTMEQIQDENEARSMQFREDLSEFLGLRSQILEPLGKENVNRFVSGPQRHPEIIDICEAEFASVRQKLLRDSATTVEWIQQNVLLEQSNPWIRTSSPSHLQKVLDDWKRDPCSEHS